MAATRAATGNSKPRIIAKIEEPAKKPRAKTTKKKTASTTKANSSKPRSKKASTDKVKKSTSAAGRPKKSTTTTTTTTTKKPKATLNPKKKETKTTTKKTTTTTAAKGKAAGGSKGKPASVPAVAKEVVKGDDGANSHHKLAEPNHEPTLLDQVKGAVLKVEGLVTGKTGKKAAGTAKQRGTSR